MRLPKRYGESRVDRCPFCQKQAVLKNSQGVPVCANHRQALLDEMRCTCGGLLEPREGKYGLFFLCPVCGPQSPRKVLEMNTVKDVSENSEPRRAESRTDDALPIERKPQRAQSSEPRGETIVRSDDPRYFS